MTDPYADVDSPRSGWIWWSVGLYCASFVVPCVPLWGQGFSLGIHLFVISFLSLVVGLVSPGIWGSERDTTMFLCCGLPWLANPLLWWCLLAWADDRRRTAAATGLLAFLCGLAAILFGFIMPPYWIWMASLALPTVGLAVTRSADRSRVQRRRNGWSRQASGRPEPPS